MEKIKELNVTELEQINGGWSACVGIGISGGPMAQACWGEGKMTEDNTGGVGVTACAFIGFGVGDSEELVKNTDNDPHRTENA